MEIDGECWSFGAQAFITGIEYDTTIPGIDGAKACNSQDLFGKRTSVGVDGALIFGAETGPDGTGNLTAGLGFGASFAIRWCETRPYVPNVEPWGDY